MLNGDTPLLHAVDGALVRSFRIPGSPPAVAAQGSPGVDECEVGRRIAGRYVEEVF